MFDLIVGIIIFVVGYKFEASMINGDPMKFFYAIDILGALMVVSGIVKLIRGPRMDDR